jgi:two-component system cell cycle sensor histidine kinase/response regulator CckA
VETLGGPLDDLTEQLLEGSAAGLLVVDEQGRLVRTNARLRSMIGHAGTARRGLPAMRLFAADERDALWRRLRGLWHGQAAPGALAARLVRDGAADLPVELAVLALHEPDGRVRAVMLAVTDVTVRRRLEAQLEQGQKLLAVGQLAAGIAHDFNNLLTVIGGTAQLIGERAGVDAETRMDAEEIGGSVARGSALVEQLLSFGRTQTPQIRRVVVDDAIRALSGLLVRLLGRGISLHLDLRCASGAVRTDATQLDQVLLNLAVNARDAMPAGGALTLRSERLTLAEPLTCAASAIPPGSYARIEVCDTGMGMPPEVLARVFEPYFTTRGDAGGTGLGLATVQTIVRLVEGGVNIHSRPGGGTTVQIYVPLAAEAGSDDGAGVRSAPAEGHTPAARGVVLVVEDEEAVLRMAERVLRQAGWEVLTADSAEAALALFGPHAQAPRLMISDMVLPGLDGAALAAALRRRWPCMPVLMVSGYADAALRARLEQTDVRFMAKPYRLADLVAQAATLTDRGGLPPGC